ncbi:MAG: hypothetical protein ACR2HP_08525 [Ilumatobacteraceae bacterium]
MGAIVLTSVLLLAGAACGGGETTSEPAGIALPADPDAVVVRWSVPVGNGVEPGGTARLVITAGGAVYQAAGSVEPEGLMAAPPEPASGDYVEPRLEPDGLQRLLARANDLGLLGPPPDYADIGVTDSASTEVVLAIADGESSTWRTPSRTRATSPTTTVVTSHASSGSWRTSNGPAAPT